MFVGFGVITLSHHVQRQSCDEEFIDEEKSRFVFVKTDHHQPVTLQFAEM